MSVFMDCGGEFCCQAVWSSVIFTRASSYCFQRVLAIAILFRHFIE